MIAHQPQPQTAGSSANQQRPGEGASIPNYVLIFEPGTLLKTQHQENNLPSTAPLYFPMPYSSSVDMFCQIHPTHLSNMHYPLAPMLVPLMYPGSTAIQIPSSQAQRPNDTSLDATFLQANVPHFLGPSPVSTHTPLSRFPFFNVSPTRGPYLSYGSDSSLVQNQEPEASSDPIPVHGPATVTEPPGFPLPTAERYNELWMFYESSQHYLYLLFPPGVVITL